MSLLFAGPRSRSLVREAGLTQVGRQELRQEPPPQAGGCETTDLGEASGARMGQVTGVEEGSR